MFRLRTKWDWYSKTISHFPLDIYKPLGYISSMTKEELRKWREDHGHSQASLARALDIAVMTVSRWERGAREIPPFLHLALKWLGSEGSEKIPGRQRAPKKTRKEV